MIIWINGAFGSGKTKTAIKLHRRLPDSFIYDPERVGYFLRKNQPPNMLQYNFQDEPLWRSFNFDILLNISRNFDGVIIAPMTIYNEQYYIEIIKQLRDCSIRVDHYVIGASKKVILKRLRTRLDNKDSWAANQIDLCVNGFKNPVFENYISSDNMTIDAVVEYIAKHSQLEILPRKQNAVSNAADKFITLLEYIRRK